MLYPLSYGGEARILAITVTNCLTCPLLLARIKPSPPMDGQDFMNEENVQETMPEQSQRHGWRILGWVMLGIFVGAALVAAFLAYGQPGLLLEQLNLRYCG